MSLFPPLLAVLFSTPLAAAAVIGGVAAAPILIHLLNRKRFKIVPWAAMRFLLAAQKKNVRRLRLEQWILLCIRVLIGVLIVVAMCAVMPWLESVWQKVLPGGSTRDGRQGRTHRIIVIDASYSMGANVEGEATRFDRAKTIAKSVLNRSSAGDGYSLVFLGGKAEAIVTGPVDDRSKVAIEIDELKLPHGSADTAGGLSIISGMVNRPPGKYARREVIFITDIKRSTWPLQATDRNPLRGPDRPVPAETTHLAASWQSIAQHARIVFHDVARQDTDNLAITSMTLDDSLPVVGTSTSVSATLFNHGREKRIQVPVELRMAAAPRPGEKLSFLDIGQQLIDVPPGASVTVTFPLDNQHRFRVAGDHVLEIRAGEDSLKLDDVRTLATTVREKIPVLIVDNKVSTVHLETPGEWLRRLFRPTGAASQPQVVPPESFADPFRADLAKFDAVFLCDPSEISEKEVARLEAHLRRGGSVLIGLGPNVARNRDHFNERLFNKGNGILPGEIKGVRTATGTNYFTLSADPDEFKRPPLSGFRKEHERAALTSPSFHQYVRLDAPSSGPARRLLSFQKNSPNEAAGPRSKEELDAAVVEWPRHRGRVVVYCSTFNPEPLEGERFWSTWPKHLTFLPFWHETLRFAVASGHPRVLLAGEKLDLIVPMKLVGLPAKLIHCEGTNEVEVESGEVIARGDTAIVSFKSTERSGIYRVSIGSEADALFAVNVPVTAAGGGAEADLTRLTLSDLHASAPEAEFQLDADGSAIRSRDIVSQAANTAVGATTEPRGPTVARFLLLCVVALLLAESLLAWLHGSARSATGVMEPPPPTRRRLLAVAIWFVPFITMAAVLGTIIHERLTHNFLGFLPASWRQSIEQSIGVPAAAPGEGTHWRLDFTPFLTHQASSDRWLAASLLVGAIIYVIAIYRRERIGHSLRPGRKFLRHPLVALASLRIGLLLAAFLILLPQVQLTFEREGWPDVVIIFDDSRSMATEEPFTDPLLRDKTEELKKSWAELARPRIEEIERRIATIQAALQAQPSAPGNAALRKELDALQKKLLNLKAFHRLNLVKALLVSGSKDWFQTLLKDRKMRVHVFRASAQATRMAELSDPDQCARLLEEIIDLAPEGESSQIGESLATVLKSFRGGSLAGIVMFTDGQNTHGTDLASAGNEAKRRNIPLFLVGIGEKEPPPDIIVSDLKAERVINLKDRLIFEVKVSSQGPGFPETVPITLYEIVDGKPVSRQVKDVTPNGKPITLSHVPESEGDKQYVVKVEKQEGEINVKNNHLEHDVYVAKSNIVSVLLIEGSPRYEYRFIKTLFERENKQVAGNKSIELEVLLLGAARDFAKQDKSAITEFPSADVLNRKYDVVILGDFDPKLLPRDQTQIKHLADFVRDRGGDRGGGGLLMIAGEHFSPHAFTGTDLADVLPITTEGLPVPAAPKLTDPPLIDAYQPRLTPQGLNHPIFRFVRDEAENIGVWNRLAPLLWYAKSYRRKLSAEVLAVHPERLAEPGPGIGKGELHPLVLQQFVGTGRVMFFGFDETWRWRMRQDEVRFNQFWIQTIRSLARARVDRTEVSVERKIYRRDEPIRINVRFPDDAPAPTPQEAIRIEVERRPLNSANIDPVADPQLETIDLTLVEGKRATYEALLTNTPEGEYRFTLKSPAVEGKKPRAETTVLPPKGELENVRLNETDLKQAGKYVPLYEADQIPKQIPELPRVALNQPCDPFSIWNHPLMFALVFGLLLAEWVLRKKARLL